MSNFSFKGDFLYRLIPSGGIDLFISISRDTGMSLNYAQGCAGVTKYSVPYTGVSWWISYSRDAQPAGRFRPPNMLYPALGSG